MTQTTSIVPSDAQAIHVKALRVLETGRSLINHSYLSDLADFPVQAFSKDKFPLNQAADVRLFRIERIVQDNKQSVLESTTAAYTALGAAGYTVFLFLRSNGIETDVYIGTRSDPGKMLGKNAGDLLRETFRGHFAGSSLLAQNGASINLLLEEVLSQIPNPAASITAVTGVPSLSTDNREHFMQGLERFIDAAENRKYQAIILAEPVSPKNLDVIRAGYEQVATQISPLLKQQLSFGVQDSDSVGSSISKSLSESLGQSLGLTETRGYTFTSGTSTTETTGVSESLSSQTGASKAASLLPMVGGVIGGALGGPVGSVMGSNIGSATAQSLNEHETTGTNSSSSEGKSESHSTSTSDSVATTDSKTRTTGITHSDSINRSIGKTRQVSIEFIDKSIDQLLSRIDQHLARIDEAKTYGGWNSAAYFIGDNTASSEALASIFLGLVRGSNSCHEDFALTTWGKEKKDAALAWLGKLTHPKISHEFSPEIQISELSAATLISGKEMAIQLSLPRRSTSTVAVVETQSFGRKVQRIDGSQNSQYVEKSITLGNVRHLWDNLEQKLSLDLNQLSGHVFISGSTGAGKSNTLYEMLDQVYKHKIPFLVIEPAKGEYKHVFGHYPNVRVFGTNPRNGEILRINPFRFPIDNIHVLEHVDRLIEIFNVCWPMYSAMPAVLKDAMLTAYERCGWDLDSSINRYSDELFPCFEDLLAALELVIKSSAYSEELKANYLGSLATRVKSLTNGLNGQIFSANEVDSKTLFDSFAVVDLSRVGSAETKSLIMGILIMRLGEYRMAQGGMNQSLRHVTVLEEAHNILRKSQTGGVEGANLAQKSVEMLANAIAEMRTYGEGFFIVDQSPNAVDIAAIRNTNTKIIMRLPDEMDRQLVGKSAGLRDDQLDEIARLPKGVAIVYQNDWLEPVLCQVNKFSGEEKAYVFQKESDESNLLNRRLFNASVLKMLFSSRLRNKESVDLSIIKEGVGQMPVASTLKIALYNIIDVQQRGEVHALCHHHAFANLAKFVVDLLGCRSRVLQELHSACNYEQLRINLNSIACDFAVGLSDEIALATQHCMMKDYSSHGDGAVEIYSAWRKNIECWRVM